MSDSELENAIDRRNTGLERHFATVVTMLILGAVIWAGDSLINLGVYQTKMVGTMNVMQVEITHLREMVASATSNRYTSKDAEMHLAPLKYRLNNIEKQLEECKGRHDKLEVDARI